MQPMLISVPSFIRVDLMVGQCGTFELELPMEVMTMLFKLLDSKSNILTLTIAVAKYESEHRDL